MLAARSLSRVKSVLFILSIALSPFFAFSQNAALDFDGTNDYVRVLDHSSIDFTSTMTLEAWINLPNVTGTRAIISKYYSLGAAGTNTSYQLYVNGGSLSLAMNESDESGALASQSTGTIATNTWYHVAGVADGSGGLLLYLNGLLVGSSTYDNTIYSGTRNLVIGRTREDDAAGATDGVIDEVRLWNTARTQEQIAAGMNHALTGSESGLVGYYQFNDGTAGADNTGDVFTPDGTGNANGVMTNMALTGASSNYVAGFSETNHALDLDGSNDYVTVSSPYTSFGSEITVETWINLSTLTSAEGVMGQSTADSDNSGTNVWLLGNIGTSDGSLTFFVWDGSNVRSATSTTDFAGTGWHHVVGVADATSTRIYVDGILEASGTGVSSGIQSNGSAAIHIGKDSRYSAARFVDGIIDEVRIWSDARACSEILSVKDVELTGSESGLVAYYNFNHGVSAGTNTGLTTIPDLSGNNSDGTLTNLALSGSSSNYVDGSGNSVTGNTPSDQPEINVQGNSNNIADGSTAINATIDTDFGTQTSSNAIIYTIQNTGTATLNISSITSSGANSGDFVVSGAPTTVTASGSETFTVTFSPLATGTRNATITINSDDCDEAAYDFAVQGVGGPATAIDFDGSNDWISGEQSLPVMSDFTIETWVNVDQFSSGNSAILIYDGGLASGKIFFQFESNNLYLSMFGNGPIHHVLNATSFNTDTWYHVAVVYSSSGQDLEWYVNGSLLETDNYSTAISTLSSTYSLGARNDGSNVTNHLDGQLDELRIWNTTRTQTQISDNMNTELVGNESGLVGYFTFDEGSAGQDNSALDALVTNHTGACPGVMNNFAQTGTASNWVEATGLYISEVSQQTLSFPEINVQGNSNDIADGSTTISATIDTDFGLIYQSGNVITYTIQNTGAATLNISSITSAGANSGDFVVSGAPTTVAVSGSETFVVTFTPDGSGTRNATITINSNDCDEAAYDFAVQGSGPAPGGISSDLQLWLNAGEGFAASQWDDQSGNDNHATQGTGSAQPSSTSNAINFNTAVDFDGSDFLTLTNDAGTMGLNNSDYELLFVANSSSTDIQFLMSAVTQERYEMHINGAAGHRFIPANASDFSDIGSNSDYDDGISRIFGGTLQSSGASAAAHVNGLFTADIETAGLQTTETGAVTIGRRESNDSFHWLGQMGETIIFGDALTATQRLQVFSYLAVKYGITLDQSTATNYLASDGATVWDATSNATYNTDVSAIARDDASGLDQRKSASINTNAILTIANGDVTSPTTFSADDSWLVWGHDNGATTFGVNNIDNSNGSASNRMSRVWRVDETGTIGDVEISFSNSLATGPVSLVVHNSDATFPADGNRRIIEMVDNGSEYGVTVDFADGDYFSFVNTNYRILTSQLVVINEVVTDPQQDWGASSFYNPSPGGTGDEDDEWIELYIDADFLDMSSWTIEMNDGTDESGSIAAGGAFTHANYRSLTGGTLASTRAGDYLILGDPASGMMNSTGTLTVILNDATGTMVDQVVIATGSGTGFNSNASDITDEAVARIPNGSDSDVDATDFVKTKATLGSTSSPSGTVFINEIVTDAFTDWETNSFDGSDGGVSATTGTDEWVELYIGTDGLNLTSWSLEATGFSGDLTSSGAFQVSNYLSSNGGTFLDTKAGDYLVLGNPTGSAQMTNSDLLILKDASGATVDQVKLGGGSGEAPSGANSAFNSEAIARYPNIADTNTDDVDFIQTRPTLGSTNSPAGTVVINEIVTDPQQDWSTNGFDGTIAGGSVTGSDEWIELYIGTDSVNLTGWTLRIEDGTDSQDGIITTSGPFGDAVYFSNNSGEFVNTRSGDLYVLGNATGEMDDDVIITLRDASGSIVDQVELGDDIASDGAGDGAPDGTANGGAATGISDEAIARIPNGADTGNDVTDFAAVPASLGSTNSIAQLPGIGNGLVFDGTDDYVNIASPYTGFATEITVEAWINLNTLTSAEGIMAQSTSNSDNSATNVWLLGNIGTSDGSLTFFVWDGSNVRSATSTTDFRGAGWHHIVGVSDAASTRIYVDGILEASGAAISSGIQSNGSAIIHIGKDARYASGRFMDGSVDEVRIWSTAKTQEEIVENMTGLLDPTSPNLQAYYRFDQSSGVSLPDLTTNDNDGTLTNMAGTEWAAAAWNIFAQNAAILQSGGTDVSAGTSGELTLTDVSFLHDDNDLLLAGHDNGSFSEVTTDLPTGTLLSARYERTWSLRKNDASGTSNGSITLAFDLGSTPDVTYNYYLLERTGTSGDFAIVPALGINPNGNSVAFTVDASAIDDGSYYTLGRSDAGVGNAIAFDGSDDHMVVPHNSSLNLNSGDFTIEGWVYPKLASPGVFVLKGRGGLVTEAEDYGIFLFSNIFALSIGKSGGFSETKSSSTNLTINAWNHIAAVYNSSTMTVTLYLNGMVDGTGTYSGTFYTSDTEDLYIGRQGSGGGGHFNGNMDEIRIWNDQRTQQELLDNMFTNLTGDEANLVAYYRFNQGIGDNNASVPDLSPNGFGGTLTNLGNLGASTASSNYITSTRSAVDQSAVIANGGDLTNTDGELTITSTQTAGDFLQDANDYLRWNNDGGAFSETTADVPTGTLVTSRYLKTWIIDKNDVVGTADGNLTFTFDLGGVPDPDYTYFLLGRASTSGDFAIVEVVSSAPSGNTIAFKVDAGEITDNYYFTLGRTDAGAGNALDFDGSNDYLTVPHNAALNLNGGDFTLEAWVYPEATNPGSILLKGLGGLNQDAEDYHFLVVNSKIYLSIGKAGTFSEAYSATTSVTLNSWNHLAVSYNSSTRVATFYLNGIEDGSETFSGTFFSTDTNDLYIGRQGAGGGGYFSGSLDEIRLWSEARSQEQIQDNMNRKLDVASESQLEAYYQFNTGIAGGTNTSADVLTDRSGNGHGATLLNFGLSSTSSNWVQSNAIIGDQAIAEGLIGAGNALDFDGSDDHVLVSDNSTLESSSLLTIEAWVRPDATSSFRGLVSRYFTSGDASNAYLLEINSGNYNFVINESDNNLVSASGSATASTWTHVAGVADGTNVHLYIDGILVASTAYDGSITSNSSRDLYIGRYRNDGFGYFDGQIDEVRIWNVVRSGADIQANMFEQLTGSETGLVAYYRFDEALGTSLDDDSPNSNTGTLVNMDNADWVDASAREPFKTNGAGNLNSGGTWVGGSAPGASETLYVQHNLTVDADLTVADLNLTSGNTLTLNASQTLTVTGNLINNGTIAGDGKIQFTSGSPMISGGTFSNLEMNGGSPMLCGETTMTGTLTLTSGNIQLQDYNLILNAGASISGGSSTSYVRTLDQNSSGGYLQMELGSTSGPATFPIGTANYTPISLLNLGSTVDFRVRVFDGVYVGGTSGSLVTTNEEINKTWDVSPQGSGYNVTLTLQWNGTDEDASFDRTDMLISRNGASGVWGAIARNIAAAGSDPYTASASGITTFCGIGGGSGGTTLPVTLLDFIARKEAGGVSLLWHTATEHNNDKFIVERSSNGMDFQPIGDVNGAGQSDVIIEYSWFDKQPDSGINYYRLKQVDFDGGFEYSAIVEATHTEELAALRVYPNPFENRLHVRLPKAGETARISIYDLRGNTVYDETSFSIGRFVSIDHISFPPGIYVMKVRQGGNVYEMKLIKD